MWKRSLDVVCLALFTLSNIKKKTVETLLSKNERRVGRSKTLLRKRSCDPQYCEGPQKCVRVSEIWHRTLCNNDGVSLLWLHSFGSSKTSEYTRFPALCWRRIRLYLVFRCFGTLCKGHCYQIGVSSQERYRPQRSKAREHLGQQSALQHTEWYGQILCRMPHCL